MGWMRSSDVQVQSEEEEKCWSKSEQKGNSKQKEKNQKNLLKTEPLMILFNQNLLENGS